MDLKSTYDSLNPAQRQAVDTIEGPMLVVAGPGTGKTQLLSARVARILESTDTLPQNILCLTFTESGAANMRERLTRFIGKEAYDVTISTYHAFGGDIIGRYGHYFDDERLETPIDNLGKHQIVAKIVEQMSYSDALKQTQHHLKDLIATISEIKRALLTPNDLRAIADENQQFFDRVNLQLAAVLSDFTSMPRKLDIALGYFENIKSAINAEIPSQPANQTLGSLAQIAADELNSAISSAIDSQKTNPLTKWKSKWLEKDADNHFIISGRLENRRLRSLASVLESYQRALAAGGFYDFDDMILRAISALDQHDDLRFTLQEQYLYILLDEYQDTNAAQARLVQLITDNPVNEGRPNVMAVGDDDQAIYAFQGAQYSNMLDFFKHYRGTAVINLTENYRSHADILKTAENIAGQIDSRLFHHFDGASKSLTASNPKITTSHIERRDFQSSIAENTFIAGKIRDLIDRGVAASDIAVLAPKHHLLEQFVPYAGVKQIPLHYEKRENILESAVIKQLLAMSRLILLIRDRPETADSLWPEVLSYDFFAVPVSKIWQLGWKVRDHNRSQSETKITWTEAMLASEDEQLRSVARLFTALSYKVELDSCELMLDYLIGTVPVKVNEPDEAEITSPFHGYLKSQSDQSYYDAISNLTVLRSKLRDYQASADSQAALSDLLRMVDAYNAADERMLNTSPYHQSDQAVQLMTVFKAKGLEFSHVFLLSVDDQTWGGSGQSMSNKLTLPKNLAPTRHSGATEDERLRVLFVALTRAKIALYLTSSRQTYAGKTTTRLKYLDEREQEDGSFIAHAIAENQDRKVHYDDTVPPQLSSLEINWRTKHQPQLDANLKDLLAERLTNYQLSPTDLISFLDLKYGGPHNFLLKTLLGFPSAPSIDGQFGTAMHNSLRWFQNQFKSDQQLPSLDATTNYLRRQIERLKVPDDDKVKLIERGGTALSAFLDKRGHIFKADDRAEVNFRYENVLIDGVHMTGIIDRMEVDSKAKTITVVDYKTGSSSAEKLYKYTRQLYCYKLLIENSRSFKGYTVNEGRLEFIEPDGDGNVDLKSLAFKPDELEKTRKLLKVIWDKIHTLDFPDVSDYPPTPAGSKQFENDLLQDD